MAFVIGNIVNKGRTGMATHKGAIHCAIVFGEQLQSAQSRDVGMHTFTNNIATADDVFLWEKTLAFSLMHWKMIKKCKTSLKVQYSKGPPLRTSFHKNM